MQYILHAVYLSGQLDKINPMDRVVCIQASSTPSVGHQGCISEKQATGPETPPQGHSKRVDLNVNPTLDLLAMQT